MIERREGMRVLAVITVLAGSATLHAQTPQINSLTSGPQTNSVCAAQSHGAAITAGTQAPGGQICLYINGSFLVNSFTTNTPTYLSGGQQPTMLPLDEVSQSATQIVALVPASLYASPGNLIIGVTQTVNTFSTPPVTTNSNGVAFTINPVLSGGGALPSGVVGEAYSAPFFAGGTAPFTFDGGQTAPGLSYATANGNLLTGTPTAAGLYYVSPTIVDTWGNSYGPIDDSIQIYNQLQIATTSLPNGVINTSYSASISGTGGESPYNWSATGLPNGLNLNAVSGVLSGTPTQSGNFTANIALTDGSGQAARAQLPLTIFAALTITTTSLPNGRINTAYPSTTLTATGGATPYTWTATGLPAGLSLNPNSGVLSGTPTQSGPFTANITLRDSSGQTANTQLSFTIFATLTISTTSLPNGRINAAYPSTTLAASGGASPYTWSATGLPPGLSLNPSTGVLSGTPTQSGNFTANVTVTDSSMQTATAQLPFSIFAILTITSTSLPNGRFNTAYSATLTGSGGATPYTWTATGLPTGLSLNPSTGVLSGTPTQSGSFTASVTLTDASSQTATAQFPFTIFATLTISTTSLPNGRINTAYSTTITGTGGLTPYYWTASGLPAGLTLNSSTGVLSGTPTQSGTFTVNVLLTDSNQQTAQASLSLTIVPTLVILTTSLPAATVGTPYSVILSGSGGTPPYLWAVTGLPAGLSLNPSTGVISGTPTQSGTLSVSITLTDNSGQTARATYGITTSSPPIPPVQITTSSLPNGTVGVFYASLIGATGGNGGPYTFTASGNLPPGLQVATNGQLQGTPTTPGTFSFSVNASDSVNNNGSGTVSITIVPAPLVITTGALSSVQVGSTINTVFTATGGVPPLTFSLGGTAPAGTSFSSSGTLSGTATTAGTYTFTVTVTDSTKTTASKSFTLVVTPATLTISASLPAGQAGSAYTGQFSATGGTPPYTWTGTSGGGLSVSASGAVSGTPTVAGTYPVSVTVTDSQGVKASGTFSVTINPSSLAITTSSLPNGALTSAYSANLTATGGTPPYAWSVSGLPAGITASSGGVLSGTPTSPGTFTVSATVKDSTGVAVSANLSLTVLAAPLKITTTGITPPTLGQSFSLAFGVTGGTPPYTWSASGLPAGVTMSSTGTLSGTPTAIGTSTITVNVADSNGLQASETLSLTVNLPAPPTLTISGLPTTANPGTQSTGTVTFSATYPVPVTVTLTLTFVPLSGADDPNIQFSTGGRTATLTIPAGSTASTASIGVQTGTVAGTITITSQLTASGQNITPSPAPTKTIVIAPGPPTITSVSAATNSTGFTVTIDGFDPTRAVTQVVFTFTGTNLQTTSVTVSAASLFTTWYQSSASTPFGSQFSFTIPFTVTGSVQSISSVSVTLVNPTGTSPAMSATI